MNNQQRNVFVFKEGGGRNVFKNRKTDNNIRVGMKNEYKKNRNNMENKF